MIVAIGRAFDRELIAGAKTDVRDGATSRAIGADFRGGQLIGGRPLGDWQTVEKNAKFCVAVFYVEIKDCDVVVPFFAGEFVTSAATLQLGAFDGSALRGVLPRSDSNGNFGRVSYRHTHVA